MSEQSRRSFLKKAVGAVPGAAIAGSLGMGACGPDGAESDADLDQSAETSSLSVVTLRAVADVALPTGALEAEGTESAVLDFIGWVEGFEPAAELDHPYLTGELRYGLPHPGPRWAAQLEAMELEARRRSGVAFAERPEAERRAIVADAIRGEASPDPPGDPARANHVAVGLLAWFYGTSEATDLCYRAEVGRHLCRGTASLPDEPAALEEG